MTPTPLGSADAAGRLTKLALRGPIVQVAIDVLTIDEALRIGEMSVAAGADWLEAGTPLITYEGVRAIGALARAFPGVPVLADYKMMDGVRKYVVETARQGGRIATICSVASDASVRAAVAAGNAAAINVICDLYAHPDVPGRAVELEAMGVDSVYVHLGADQRAENPARSPFAGLAECVERVKIPVGVGTFKIEEAREAFRLGATIAVIGHPVISAPDARDQLRRYVEEGKAAWNARR